MKKKAEVRATIDKITNKAVTTPAICVLAPEALLITVLVKDPVTGIDLTKEPIILQAPKAISSWLMSNVHPLAKKLFL